MHITRKIRRILALLTLAATLSTSAMAEFPAVVTTGKMAVYADAARSWKLGTLPGATVVTVRSYENGVAEIERDGNVGYAKVSDMTALSELATPVVVNTASRVYQQPNLKSRWASLSKGTEVNLLATNGRWAMVEKNGCVAYTNRDHLTEVGQSQPEETPAQPEVIWENFTAYVLDGGAAVYAQASASSKEVGRLPKSTAVTVTAYCDGWAYIELNGNRGFAQIADLTREQPKTAKTIAEQQADGVAIQKIIYNFLTGEMKLNAAAACGILANIERESDFNLTCQSYDGGYGLIQWTGGRNTKLKKWCAENGYDHASLEGQLRFLKYELENTQTKTMTYLKGVENSAAGAYDAAYYFCYNFEIPASRAKRSVERGNIAKNTYWIKYAA